MLVIWRHENHLTFQGCVNKLSSSSQINNVGLGKEEADNFTNEHFFVITLQLIFHCTNYFLHLYVSVTDLFYFVETTKQIVSVTILKIQFFTQWFKLVTA